MQSQYKKMILSSVATMLTVYGVPGHVQNSSSAAVSLEEITVTARRREESSLSVPFMVNVLDGSALESRRIDNVADMFQEIPNLSYNSYDDGRTTSFQIRGAGPVAALAGTDDSSVVTYIDGVPQPLFASDVQLVDLERVEVLKGPQGTLFGRNSAAGAINFVTAAPTSTPQFRLNAEGGTEGLLKVSGIASGPLAGDVLTGRVSVSYAEQDGYVKNSAADEKLGWYSVLAARGSLQYAPSDGLNVRLSASGETSKREPLSSMVLKSPTDFPRVSVLYNDIDRDLATATLDVSYETSFATLKSVSGVHDLSAHLLFDSTEGVAYSALFNSFGLPLTEQDFIPDLDASDWREEEIQLSQEVRLESLPGSALTWVAGFSYLYSDFDLHYVDRSVFSAPIPNGTRDQSIKTESMGIFGEVSLPVTGKLTVALGLRGNREEKRLKLEYAGNGFPGTVDAFSQRDSIKDDFAVGRVSLTYGWSENSNSYAVAGRGYKTAGYPRYATGATVGVASPPYDPAQLWSYELGHKAKLWNGRMRWDTAVFLNEVNDEHVFFFAFPITYDVLNLDTRSYGIETSIVANLGAGLQLSLAGGYTDAEFDNPPAGAPARDKGRVPGVPRVSTSVGLEYRNSAAWLGLSDGELSWRIAHQYVGERAADAANSFMLDSYRNVSARIGIDFGELEIYVFGDNLLDEQFQAAGILYAPGIETVSLGRGLTAGVGASLRF